MFVMAFYVTIINTWSYVKLIPRKRVRSTIWLHIKRNTIQTKSPLQRFIEIVQLKLTKTLPPPTISATAMAPETTTTITTPTTITTVPTTTPKTIAIGTSTTMATITAPDQANNTLCSKRAILNQGKAVVTLLILTILYWICCAPLITLFSLWPNVYYSPDKLLMNASFYLYYAYSGINSLVYILRTKKLRKYFGTILRNKKTEKIFCHDFEEQKMPIIQDQRSLIHNSTVYVHYISSFP